LDNGLGIPKSELEPIFSNSNKEKSLEHGSSLDLWLIKFVMEISNISISFDCNKKRTSVNLVLN